MKALSTSILCGTVAHQRVTPVRHKLRYNVFSLLLDLDEIGEVAKRHRFFSHNRWNLLSVLDKDLANGSQTDLAAYARNSVRQKLGIKNVAKVLLITYPRVLGFVFNPLSVYLCVDERGDICCSVFEVSNTFGERTSYVCGVNGDVIDQVQKSMLVSPFNDENGEYSFRLSLSDNTFTVGVALREAGTPVINTWFHARRLKFTDTRIIKCLAAIPFMTLKVVAAIHYEALKLWLKGLRPSWSCKDGNKPEADLHSSQTLLPGG